MKNASGIVELLQTTAKLRGKFTIEHSRGFLNRDGDLLIAKSAEGLIMASIFLDCQLLTFASEDEAFKCCIALFNELEREYDEKVLALTDGTNERTRPALPLDSPKES